MALEVRVLDPNGEGREEAESAAVQELIALQFARFRVPPGEKWNGKALARERSLLEKHRGAWLGPAWERVYRVPAFGVDLAFERGFLAQAVTSFLDGNLKKAHSDPRWSAVRTLMASDPLVNADGSLWPPLARARDPAEMAFGSAQAREGERRERARLREAVQAEVWPW